MNDYLSQSKSIREFYHNFPNKEGFFQQINEKETSFSKTHRKVLVEALKEQYVGFDASEKTLDHINILSAENAYTITTGHQLNLFTGPLYFLYKIISVINLCEELQDHFSTDVFVPVYWMATEDHDFDEINYFNFKEPKSFGIDLMVAP